MDLVPPLAGVQACSMQIPLDDDCEGPRAPLRRQVSLDEERRDECRGHWRGDHIRGEEEERGVRLFRAMLLHHLRLEQLRPPPCIVAGAVQDPRGWWMYWRDWRCLERAALKFRRSRARGRLAARASQIELLRLDEVEFEDIMQELCQACAHIEQRALVVLAFLCEVCARAVRHGGWCRAADWAASHVAHCATPWAIRHGGWQALVLAFLCEVCARAVRHGGWCRAADWAASHVAHCATPWAIRHGGWSAVVEKAAGTRREENTFIAGAALAVLLAFLVFCRTRLRHSIV